MHTVNQFAKMIHRKLAGLWIQRDYWFHCFIDRMYMCKRYSRIAPVAVVSLLVSCSNVQYNCPCPIVYKQFEVQYGPADFGTSFVCSDFYSYVKDAGMSQVYKNKNTKENRFIVQSKYSLSEDGEVRLDTMVFVYSTNEAEMFLSPERREYMRTFFNDIDMCVTGVDFRKVTSEFIDFYIAYMCFF